MQPGEHIALQRDGQTILVPVSIAAAFTACGWLEITLARPEAALGTDPAPLQGQGGATAPQCEIELNGK